MKELVAQDVLDILGEINFGKDYKGMWEFGRHNVEDVRSYQGHYYECLVRRSPINVNPPDEDGFGWKRCEPKEKKGEPVKVQIVDGNPDGGSPLRVQTIGHRGAALRADAALAALPFAMQETQGRDAREAARMALEHADALLEALDA